MAEKFWVGGAGDWSNTAHWASTSGGAGGKAVPTSIDNVTFDSNSGTGLVTGSGSKPCLDFNVLDTIPSTLGLRLTGTLYLHGNLNMKSAGLIDSSGSPNLMGLRCYGDGYGANTYTLRTGNATSTPNPTQKIGSVEITCDPSEYQMISDLWCYGNFQLTDGTFNLMARTLDIRNPNTNSSYLNFYATWTRTFTGSAGCVVNINKPYGYDGQIRCISSSGLTISLPSTATINLYGEKLDGDVGLNFPCRVNIQSSSNTNIDILGDNTFNSLNLVNDPTGLNRFVFSGNTTVSSSCFSNGTSTSRNRIESDTYGIRRSLSGAFFLQVSGNFSYTDFKSISRGELKSSTSLGDCGYNIGTNALTTPVTRYAVLGTATKYWNDITMWSTTSGGATGASVPLPQDTVIFNAASGSGTCNMKTGFTLGKNLTMTGFTGEISDVLSNNPTTELFGNLVVGNNNFNVAPLYLSGNSGSYTITSAGNQIIQAYIDAPGASYSLNDDLNIYDLNLKAGTFSSNSKSVLTQTFLVNTANPSGLTRTLDMGSSIWTISPLTSSMVVFSIGFPNTYPGLVVNSGTSTLIFDDSQIVDPSWAASDNELRLANSSFYNITFSGTTPYIQSYSLLGDFTVLNKFSSTKGITDINYPRPLKLKLANVTINTSTTTGFWNINNAELVGQANTSTIFKTGASPAKAYSTNVKIDNFSASPSNTWVALSSTSSNTTTGWSFQNGSSGNYLIMF